MTPKEQASHIFLPYYVDLILGKEKAKQCAIFTVIYILANMEISETYKEYYQEVLEELKKM
jgi:hypothetical protein